MEQNLQFLEKFTTFWTMMDGLNYGVLNLLLGMETDYAFPALCQEKCLEDVTVQMDWIFLADCFCENLQE